MNNLRRLGGAAALILALGISIFGGDTQTPPCAPGEMNTPPCASMMSSSDATLPGETSTPPASESFDVLSLAETVLSMVF
jgi:hypothetical protein